VPEERRPNLKNQLNEAEITIRFALTCPMCVGMRPMQRPEAATRVRRRPMHGLSRPMQIRSRPMHRLARLMRVANRPARRLGRLMRVSDRQRTGWFARCVSGIVRGAAWVA
jgi:hypothetical protein